MTKSNKHNLKLIRNDNVTEDAVQNNKPELEVIENNNLRLIADEEDLNHLANKSIDIINDDGSKVELERVITENEYLIFLDQGLGSKFYTSNRNEISANLIAKKLRGKCNVKLGTTISTNLDLSEDKSDPFYIVQDYFLADDSEELKKSKMDEWLKVYPNAIYK